VLCQEGLPLRHKGLPFGLKKPKKAHGTATGTTP
jgi:hypothetical protein